MKKLYSNMIFDLVVAALLLALGIVLLPPVTDLGSKILSVIVAVLLVCYLVFWLFERLIHSRGAIQILTLVEFVLIALIALGLIFKQFNIIKIDSVCQIIGAVFWLRGCTGAFRGYFVHTAKAQHRFPILMFVLSLTFITFGAVLVANPFFTNETVVYILAILCILLAVALLLYALLCCRHPAKKKSAKK